MKGMKRLGLGLVAGLLALAFAALPAVAAAEVKVPAFWTVDGEPLQEGEHEALDLHGTLQLESLGIPGATVTCDVEGTDTIWNEPANGTLAQDEITEFNILAETCVTAGPIAACGVAKTGVANLAWPTLAYFTEEEGELGGGRVDVEDVTFTNEFVGEECPFKGVNLQVGGVGQSVTGDGIFGEDPGSPCFPTEVVGVEFSAAGPLTTNPNIGPVVINGTVEVTPEEADCVGLNPAI